MDDVGTAGCCGQHSESPFLAFLLPFLLLFALLSLGLGFEFCFNFTYHECVMLNSDLLHVLMIKANTPLSIFGVSITFLLLFSFYFKV